MDNHILIENKLNNQLFYYIFLIYYSFKLTILILFININYIKIKDKYINNFSC